MIPPESIRVSTHRLDAWNATLLTIEWTVLGDRRYCQWCSRIAGHCTHHRATTARVSDVQIYERDPQWLVWNFALIDPFDIYADSLAICAGWSVKTRSFFGELILPGIPQKRLVLPVAPAATLLGCGDNKVRPHRRDSMHAPEHVCLIENPLPDLRAV